MANLELRSKKDYSPVTTAGIEITRDISEWYELADRYKVQPEEIGLIDLNRSGIHLPDGEIPENFRARFIGTVNYGNDLSCFALPVRRREDTMFQAREGAIYFNDKQIGFIDGSIELDTCDTSYQRGPHLLNLNSRSRSNCAGCRACVHNDKTLYDKRVIKDRHELTTYEDLEKFFDTKSAEGLEIDKLKQIAVVTGLFGGEANVVNHMRQIHKIIEPRGFRGELMYFGCEVNSDEALRELSNLGNTSLVYAVDNFTNRAKFLAPFKAGISLDDAHSTMARARALGIETSFAYIAGVDNIESMHAGMKLFKDVSSRFPIINVFHVQTRVQGKVMNEEAKHLEHYLKARALVEDVFQDTSLRPRRWENYRPLWYKTFGNELLNASPFGE